MKTQTNLIKLLQSAVNLDYWKDGSGAEMSITQSGGIPALAAPFESAITEISLARGRNPVNLMINVLPPGVIVPKHWDKVKGGFYERWHLPLQTNPQCIFWDSEQGERHFAYGEWNLVKHWLEHQVWNLGTVPRIHLIVDLMLYPRTGNYDGQNP